VVPSADVLTTRWPLGHELVPGRLVVTEIAEVIDIDPEQVKLTRFCTRTRASRMWRASVHDTPHMSGQAVVWIDLTPREEQHLAGLDFGLLAEQRGEGGCDCGGKSAVLREGLS
jgi:hypothetical protein